MSDFTENKINFCQSNVSYLFIKLNAVGSNRDKIGYTKTA